MSTITQRDSFRNFTRISVNFKILQGRGPFTMEDTYLTTTNYMTDILVKFEPLASSGAAGRSAESVVTPHGDVRPSSSDQLPRLNLPSFSGNIEEC